MLDSLVKIDNTLAWDGHSFPFHEAYYLIINDPNTNWSLWTRYTLCNSSPHKGLAGQKNVSENLASLWAIFIDNTGKKVAIKDNFELSKYDIVHTDQFISIGGSYLSLAEAVGSINIGKDCIKWEFIFEDPVVSLRLYKNLFYHLPIPKTKFLQPRVVSYASGQFYVNHIKKELKRSKVHQGHLYGTALSKSWAWANCIHFKEDPDAYFEGLSLMLSIGKKIKKPINIFCLSLEGMQFHCNSLTKMLINSSKYDFDSWMFSFKKSHYKFEGVIRRQPQLTAGIGLNGPNQEMRYSYLTMMASIKITVYKNYKGSWQHYKTLTSDENCTFETVSPVENKAISLDLN